jgi:homocysteine S-methyltransferase
VNPFTPFLNHQGVVLLDGGLATALETRGKDLNDPLWSARVLLEDPDAVSQVHMDYLVAGADCIATATYQATFEGFRDRGLRPAEAEEAFHRAVRLAVGARDTFWAQESNREGRLRPLVAGSIGPYGAYLADGSEYTGGYGLGAEALVRFHRRRWHLLAASGVDLLACETVPSVVEVRALLRLLAETPDVWAWMSFQCRDHAHLADGTALGEAVGACDDAVHIAAVGVNCVPPERVASLLSVARSATAKPLMAYPNSGEAYDATTKTWKPGGEGSDPAEKAPGWREGGATVLGGCCRTGPDTIARMRSRLLAPA